MNPVAQLLVIVAGLLLVGALGEFIFSRTGIPDVIWLVLAGIFAGPVFEVVSPRILESLPCRFSVPLPKRPFSPAAPLTSDSRTLLQPRRAAFVGVCGIPFFRGFDLLLFLGAHQLRVGQTRNPFIVVNPGCD